MKLVVNPLVARGVSPTSLRACLLLLALRRRDWWQLLIQEDSGDDRLDAIAKSLNLASVG